MVKDAHDALFRFTFAQPEHAAALLRSILPRRIAKAIDWATLRPLPGTQIDRRLRGQQSDLLFTARAGRRTVRIYVVFEHKSRHESWAVVQMLGYVVGLWRDLLRRRPRLRRLPPVIPVLFHHGPRRWSAATELDGLFDLDGLSAGASSWLRTLQPKFRMVVCSLADCTHDQLRAMSLTLLGKVTLAALQFSVRRPSECSRRLPTGRCCCANCCGHHRGRRPLLLWRTTFSLPHRSITRR